MPRFPRSMTLMAGPIDTRVNQTGVNELAQIAADRMVPAAFDRRGALRFPGAFRHVYPGFVQLAAFMSMNLDRHINAHLGQFFAAWSAAIWSARRRIGGSLWRIRRSNGPAGGVLSRDGCSACSKSTTRRAAPALTWHGRKVRPEAIRRMGLLTVEGERDDICAIGQTMAALDLCQPDLPAVNLKQDHLQTGVGPITVCSAAATRGRTRSIPRVREMIQVMRKQGEGAIGSGCVGSRLMGFADCAHATRRHL